MSDLGALRRITRRVAVPLAIAAALSLGAVPATAVEPIGWAPVPFDGQTHCVADVVELRSDGEMVTGLETCFGTYSQAVAFASGGTVRLPADTPGTVNNYGGGYSTLHGALATHFDGYYGTGSSVTITGGVCAGYWNTSSWWDNRISSTYNACFKTRHYDLPYLGGAAVTLSGPLYTHNLPWYMNNATESVKYYIN